MKLQQSKSGFSSVLMGLLVVIALLPYVWNYLVQSTVVVNIVLSVIVLTIVARSIAAQVIAPALRTALTFFQDIQTRPTK